MNNYCINPSFTIKEAIETIDENKNRVAIVTEDDNKVIGVLSQGDIIRALCTGKDLYSQIGSIIHFNFFYLNDRDMEEAYKIFKKYKISLLPIVNYEFKLIDLITIDDIFLYLEMHK